MWKYYWNSLSRSEGMKTFPVSICYFQRFSLIFWIFLHFLATKKLMTSVYTSDVSIFLLSTYFKYIFEQFYEVKKLPPEKNYKQKTSLISVKIKIFWDNDYDVITYVPDVTEKKLSRDPYYIVYVAMWSKFCNTSIPMREVIITLIL